MGTKAALTVADLAKLPPLRPEEGHHYELSDGELIIVGNASGLHETVKRAITRALFAYELRTGTGQAYSESQFNLAPDCARVPDVAFLLADRARAICPASSGYDTIPDLAIEVISESETAREAEQKVNEYLAAGVAEVWQVYPSQRLVRVRRATSVIDLKATDRIETALLPGFSVPVSEFFE